MGEYSREKRNQLSRAIANSGVGSRQLKEFVDNRNGNQLAQSNIIAQYKFGRPSGELISHLKGEWSGRGDGTPTGGHWKIGMTDKWRGWNPDGTLDGVHCDKTLQTNNPTYGLNGYTITKNRKNSKSKTSSFWPASWDETTLTTALENSDPYHNPFNKQNVWKTARGVYWYGNGSAYPITHQKAESNNPGA